MCSGFLAHITNYSFAYTFTDTLNESLFTYYSTKSISHFDHGYNIIP